MLGHLAEALDVVGGQGRYGLAKGGGSPTPGPAIGHEQLLADASKRCPYRKKQRVPMRRERVSGARRSGLRIALGNEVHCPVDTAQRCVFADELQRNVDPR